jgi:hypothetical protein
MIWRDVLVLRHREIRSSAGDKKNSNRQVRQERQGKFNNCLLGALGVLGGLIDLFESKPPPQPLPQSLTACPVWADL